MTRKLLIATSVALSCVCAPLLSHAEDAPTPAPTEMSKDAWLNAMSPMLPDLICKGFIQDEGLKKRFEEVQMSYEKCVSLIPDSAKKCQNEIYASIPDKIDSKIAGTWGKTFGECIGKDFAEKYLIPKS